MALPSVEVLLEHDPAEQAVLAGWVKVKRSDILLGAAFERRWALLFSNRLELWKSPEVRLCRLPPSLILLPCNT
jgi:hypothetical protein